MAPLLPTDPVIYRDINLVFTAHPVSGDLVTLTNADAVIRSIRQLVMTNFFERPFEPGIGSRVSGLLFEPIDTITERLVVDEVRRVIDTYEPRARVRLITAVANPDAHTFDLTIECEILNVPQPTSLNIRLSRLR